MKNIIKIILAFALAFNTTNLFAQDTGKRSVNKVAMYPYILNVEGQGLGAFIEIGLAQKYNMSIVLPAMFTIGDSWGEDGFEFAPGLKFYPGDRHRKVVYGIGPNVYFFRGDYSSKLGMIANNYLDINITESFGMAFEGGIGVSYIDGNDYFNPYVRFGFSLGFRF